MNIAEAFDKITDKFSPNNFTNNPPKSAKIIESSNFDEFINKISSVKVKSGDLIFFWDAKAGRINHVAIVPEQKEERLDKVNLLHSTPPGVGTSKGVLFEGKDLSGIRNSSLIEYISKDKNEYSRIIVGRPIFSISIQKEIDKTIKEISDNCTIDGIPGVYSFPVIWNLFYLAKYDYAKHKVLSIKSIILERIRKKTKITPTYCGDLVGRIYEKAGVKNIPKASMFGIKGYKSTKLYEWLRDKDEIYTIIAINEDKISKW